MCAHERSGTPPAWAQPSPHAPPAPTCYPPAPNHTPLQDQVCHLTALGIPAACMCGAMDKEARAQVYRALKKPDDCKVGLRGGGGGMLLWCG